MPVRRLKSSTAVSAAIALLSGCATPRLYSEAELNTGGLRCGLAAGELVQEADFKKMLFVYRIAPTPTERVCAYQWARARHLQLTVIESVNGITN